MSGSVLKPIDAAIARRWAPFVRGPREQWLKCEGSPLARIAAWLHFSWPTARGQWRFTRLLQCVPSLNRHLKGARFVSDCGVPITLDVASDDFLYLSGRLSSEPLELAIIVRIVRDGDMFVDVGAHRGLYVLHVLGRLGERGSYLAFEPSPSSFRFLQHAFRDSDPRLERSDVAVSDSDGEGFLSDEGSVAAHLGVGDKHAIKVRTRRLDSLLAGRDLAGRTLIVKLDTEGHEASIIRGCHGLAAAGIEPIFLIEFLPSIFGQTRGQIIEAFADTFGDCYRFFAIDAGAGRLIEFMPAVEPVEDVRNILAVPPQGIERLASLFHDETRRSVNLEGDQGPDGLAA